MDRHLQRSISAVNRGTFRLSKLRKNIHEEQLPNDAPERISSPIKCETVDAPWSGKEDIRPPSYNTAITDPDRNKTNELFWSPPEIISSRGRLLLRTRPGNWNPKSTGEYFTDFRRYENSRLNNQLYLQPRRSRSEFDPDRVGLKPVLSRVALNEELDMNSVIHKWRFSRLFAPTSRISVRRPHSVLNRVRKIQRPVDLCLRRSRLAQLHRVL
ncbi:unnamed protein product [Echinostoma caproni]|uniref:Spermatogenesis-associated protein 6 n=1 Tax=Echinostoma caproni TaxID=27848 RepID=A0A182ZZZ6_9TREM|nr:unnamed protein product [Echinostoma caproni]